MKTDDPIRQTRIAYADANTDGFGKDERCLSFLTSEWLTADRTREALQVIGQYNAFDPDPVGEMVSHIEDEIDPGALFAVGREGSPVVYVETDDPEAVIEFLGPVRYEAADYDRDDPFSSVHPDELGETEHVGSRITRERYEEGDDDAHMMCRHDEPPVEVDEWAEAGDRPVVRAWWD